jgi:hypothetical protein
MNAQTNQLPSGTIEAVRGTLFDNGGPDFNYDPAQNLQALIAPCGARSVTMEFNEWDLATDATLQLFDGVNAAAPSLGLFSNANPPTAPIVASSGALYLLWNATGSRGEGFRATWTSVEGTGANPIADFTMPGSTIYNSVFTNFINTSRNVGGATTYTWRVSGPGGTATGTNEDLLLQLFQTNGTYSISLTATNCNDSISTMTKSFVVAAPNSPTEIDVVANNQRPSLGEIVTFTATSDKANRWEYSFFPPVGPRAEGVIDDRLNQRDFSFNEAGSYTVIVRGFNTLNPSASEATVVKAAYIVVVEKCVPIVSVATSTDVGISNFKLTDAESGDVLIDNASASGIDAYTDFAEDLGVAELNYGGMYDFEITRPSNVNPMSRRIWIDWNVDGDFDDAGESDPMTMTEATGNTMVWKGTITVPNSASAFEAVTTLRIGVSYDSDPNEACGASTNPAANRIGEFEDYAIQVVNDGDIPVILLVGSDTVFIEQVANIADSDYTSDGAEAFDPSQGNITSSIEFDTDLDVLLTGIYSETYNVADASGNEASEVRRVVYVVSDQTAPEITINGLADTTIEVGSVWTDLRATAIDNKEGNLSAAIITTGTVDADLLGVYTINYSVQDFQGNRSSADDFQRNHDVLFADP